MRGFAAAFWGEALKARRSGAILLTAAVFCLFPAASGLFMIILKDPEAAREMGLLSMKAQIVAGTADWPTFFEMLLQATAMAGAILFAFITTWLFGREFAAGTAKDLMALPTSRGTIASAKFLLLGLWTLGLVLLVYLLGLGVGSAVDVPGWSEGLAWAALRSLLATGILTLMLMPFVALAACAGRGYLPALGWAFGSFILAQIIGVLGWGDWFPWSVPVLLSGMYGPQGVQQLGLHSYLLVLLAGIAGVVATVAWWQYADQAR